MVSWVRTTAFLGLVFVGLAREAQAGSGDGVGLGPVFGITTEGSLSLGWELGGSYRGPLAHASLGGSYQLKREGNDPAYYHYLVLEPWFVVGGTIGAGLTDTREVRFVYGLWEGYTADLDDPLLTGGVKYVDDDTRFHWVFSLSIGWRGAGDTQLFYVTPKVWRLKGWDFFT